MVTHTSSAPSHVLLALVLAVVWACGGCGLILGPPVSCKVEPVADDEHGTYGSDMRDVVCTAKKDLDTYRVHFEWEEFGDPRAEHYGHHGVDAGEVDRHEHIPVGARVTVEVEGYRPRVFTVR